jgi:hypothetical protein
MGEEAAAGACPVGGVFLAPTAQLERGRLGLVDEHWKLVLNICMRI